MPGGWQGSTRRDTLPADWNTNTRPAVLARDGHRCTWLDGHDDGGYPTYLAGRHHEHRCTAAGPGMHVDHVGDRLDHNPDNCRTLCPWHHNRRSSHQGNANQRRPSTRMPRGPHPGLL